VTHPVYLVRHGQSEWNALRMTQGQTSHPRLTSLGREQAERAASLIGKDLAGRPVIRIVTSDLVRAVETADVVSRTLRAPVTLDTRLREQHLGELEGRGYDETWAAAEAHDWSDPTLPLAGGESIMEVHDRLGAVLTELAELDGGVTVLVSHGDAIRAAIAHLTGLAPHRAPWVQVANGAVARIDEAITWLGNTTMTPGNGRSPGSEDPGPVTRARGGS
jgi:probable phosphoglycerate mutase